MEYGRIMKLISLLLLAVGLLASAAACAGYSRRPLLEAPVAVREDAALELKLVSPVALFGEAAQLEVVFSSAAGFVFSEEGISSARGRADLALTLAADGGAAYTAHLVGGDFSADRVLCRFSVPPRRKVPLRRLRLAGRNLPPIAQIYWVEGREKRSEPGTDETLKHCEEGRCDWREAMDYCHSRGGRLLTRAELNAMYFDECASGAGSGCGNEYWSSEEYSRFTRNAWYVGFDDGKPVAALKTRQAHVRCLVPAGAVYRSRKK